MKKSVSGLFTVAFVILFFYFLRKVNFVKAYELVRATNLFYFSIGFLLFFLALCLANWRWQVNIRKVKNIGFWPLFVFTLSGSFFNIVTPGRSTGGEILKAYYLNKKYNRPKTEFLSTILAEKFFYLFVLFIFTIFSLFLVLIKLEMLSVSRIFLEIVLVALIIFVALIIILIWKNARLSAWPMLSGLYRFFGLDYIFRLKKRHKLYLKDRIIKLFNKFYITIYDKKIFTRSIILALLFWVVSFFSVYFIFLSLGFYLNFLYVSAIFAISYFIGDISPSPGGLGITEGTMFLLYSVAGVSHEIGALATVLNSGVFYFFGFFIGGICALYLRIKYR